jgi:DNA-binding transcriptional MerR regulator
MAQTHRSIGQVLAAVKSDYPDISISKIRYLESEGLLFPERAPSGYRRYSQADIERLRYILSAQKNHYLPLKVIRQHLELIDRGLDPPAVAPAETEPPPPPPPAAGGPPPPRRPIKLSRAQLLASSGLPESTLVELERQQVVRPRRGTAFYGWEALTIATVAQKLGPFGLDARHLRVVKQAADNEVALVNQVVVSYNRRRDSARRASIDVAELILHAHAALIQVALDR